MPFLALLAVCAAFHGVVKTSLASESEILRPRVPRTELKKVRSIKNSLPATREIIAKGNAVYHEKGTCGVCPGQDGKGLGPDVERGNIKGALPRDFTDPAWQHARSDGEVLWVLKKGRPGTGIMAKLKLTVACDSYDYLQLLREGKKRFNPMY